MVSPNPAKAAEAELIPELWHQADNPTGKETILFIHGACGSSKEWEAVLPHLVLADYHILLPDLPAHGKSVSIQPFTLDYSAQLLLELIDKYAKNSCAHVVGLSLGAHIVAYMAERAKPNQILSLIASGYNSIPQSRYIRSFLSVPIFAAQHLINFISGPSKEIAQVQNGEASYELISEVTRIIFEPRALGEIRARSLIVCAAHKNSWLTRDKLESSKEMFDKVVGAKENGSRAVLHYGIRHAWHIEEPGLFAQMVLAWVEEQSLSPAFEDIE